PSALKKPSLSAMTAASASEKGRRPTRSFVCALAVIGIADTPSRSSAVHTTRRTTGMTNLISAMKDETYSKARLESSLGEINIAGERRTDVTRQRQGSRRCALLENLAAARTRRIRIRIFRKIPVRMVDLQEMMKNVADEDGTAAL